MRKHKKNVQDLDLFLTVQLLEGTPAVLSLGKLCEEHGFTSEWVSGQKPHLTKNGKRIRCKTENFVLVVVRGLSVVKLQRQFVFHIVPAGVTEYLFKSSKRAK